MTREELHDALSFMEGARDLEDLADRLWQAVDMASDDGCSMRAVLSAALEEMDRLAPVPCGGR